MEYSVEEAQRILEKLIDDVVAGKEVVIVQTRRYKLVPWHKPKPGQGEQRSPQGVKKTRSDLLDQRE